MDDKLEVVCLKLEVLVNFMRMQTELYEISGEQKLETLAKMVLVLSEDAYKSVIAAMRGEIDGAAGF